MHPPPPPLNKEGMNNLWKGVSAIKSSEKSEGAKAAFNMKIEKFNAINLEAKVKKLAKDEE